MPLDHYTDEEYRTQGRYGPSPGTRRTLTDYERQHFPGQQGKGPAARGNDGDDCDSNAMPTSFPLCAGVRWFVALYDYDPVSMSPNPDAAEEELSFREGDLIKVRARSRLAGVVVVFFGVSSSIVDACKQLRNWRKSAPAARAKSEPLFAAFCMHFAFFFAARMN